MSKTFTYEDLKAHSGRENLYISIHENVYNVAAFLDEHPGGDEVLLEEAGRDATEAFEDVGHSDEAREMLAKMIVGKLAPGENAKLKGTGAAAGKGGLAQTTPASPLSRILPIVALLAAWIAWRFFYAK